MLVPNSGTIELFLVFPVGNNFMSKLDYSSMTRGIIDFSKISWKMSLNLPSYFFNMVFLVDMY